MKIYNNNNNNNNNKIIFNNKVKTNKIYLIEFKYIGKLRLHTNVIKLSASCSGDSTILL